MPECSKVTKPAISTAQAKAAAAEAVKIADAPVALNVDGARVGARAMVAAGALVPEGMQVEPNMLVMGSPAKPRREVNEDEKARFANGARQYADRAALYKNECKEVE